MPIPFKCPQCGHEGKARDELEGRIVKCPGCKGSIEIELFAGLDEVLKSLPPPPAFSPPPAPEKKLIIRKPVVVPSTKLPIQPPAVPPATPKQDEPEKEMGGREALRTIHESIPYRGIAWVVLTITFLVTLWREEGPPNLVHYVCLMAISWLAVATVRQRWWKGMWPFLPAVFAVALAVGYFKYVDRYNHYWTNLNDGIEYTYNDWHWKSGSWNGPYWREFSYHDPEEAGWYRSSGAFSESGKQHGPWKQSMLMPNKKLISTFESDGFKCNRIGCDKTTWYWYGEVITEGEWHLRNK